jgi:hypothetical protein
MKQLFETKYGETFLKIGFAWLGKFSYHTEFRLIEHPGFQEANGNISETQLCGSVRNASKFTVKPTHSTVVKGYEKANQPLKLTISTP